MTTITHAHAAPVRSKRKLFFGVLGTAVIAAGLISPLAQTFAANAATFSGCRTVPRELQIVKTNPDGEPLAGAVFEVTGALYERAMPDYGGWPASPDFSLNAMADEVNRALPIWPSDLAAERQALMEANQAARADWQALLDERARIQAIIDGPEYQALEAQAAVAYAELLAAQAELSAAQAAYTDVEWSGDADAIAAAQAAVDAASARVNAALAESDRVNAEKLALNIPAGPTTEQMEAASEAMQRTQAAVGAFEPTWRAAMAAYESSYPSALVVQAATEGSVGTVTVTTDAEGRATVQLLDSVGCGGGVPSASGTAAPATVVEVQAPEGYQLDSTEHTETVGEVLVVVNVPAEEEEEPPTPPVTEEEPPAPPVVKTPPAADYDVPKITGTVR